MERHGVDRIFPEKMTGTKRERPEREKLLERVTAGDAVVIEYLSRLGRSTKDLIELVEFFQMKGAHLVFLKEQIDTSTGRFLFTLMSAIAQFERDIIADRTREGLEAARARAPVGGRPQVENEKMKRAVKLYHSGDYTVAEIRELTGITKPTLYRYLREGA